MKIKINIPIGVLLLLEGATYASEHSLRGIVSSLLPIFPCECPKLNLGLLDSIVFRYYTINIVCNVLRTIT
jgi:hypothetical protein